jgi:hypothetical protein
LSRRRADAPQGRRPIELFSHLESQSGSVSAHVMTPWSTFQQVAE